MRNSIVTLILSLASFNLFAQGIPVSHTPENKNVILEEFTGIYCVNCPNGHKYANQIKTAHPADVVLINFHEGGYANPNTGDPDFRTDFGTALSNLANVSGYPNAAVNRHNFGLESGGPAMTNRQNWVTAANQILTQSALANLGMEASIDVQTNLLTVRVQVYYTANPAYPSNNRLNVAVLQDDVEGPQTGMANNPAQVLPNGKYLHKNIFRHFLTGQYGRQLPSVGAGMTIDSIFTYSLPADIRDIPLVLPKLHIAAYLTDGLQEAITGQDIVPTFTNFPGVNSSKAVSAAIENDVVCGFTAVPIVTIQNFGSSALTSLYLDYSINGSSVKTMYWTGSVESFNNTEITLNDINFFPLTTNTLTVNTRLPNGATDPVTTDDEITLDFGSSKDASNAVTMALQLDNYGTEITWELLNSNQTQLYSGGPYSNNSTQVISSTFNLTSGDCYEFKIYDSYGDGLINGAGLTLQDDQGLTIIANYKSYGPAGVVPFGVDAPQPDSSDVFTGIFSIADVAGGISIFPNPANGKINVNFTNEIISSIYLTDMLGKRVKTISENEKKIGSIIQISVADLTPGIYFLNAESGTKKYTEKVLVSF